MCMWMCQTICLAEKRQSWGSRNYVHCSRLSFYKNFLAINPYFIVFIIFVLLNFLEYWFTKIVLSTWERDVYVVNQWSLKLVLSEKLLGSGTLCYSIYNWITMHIIGLHIQYMSMKHVITFQCIIFKLRRSRKSPWVTGKYHSVAKFLELKILTFLPPTFVYMHINIYLFLFFLKHYLSIFFGI